MSLEILFLSFRNLSRRRTRSYLTMIGIFIGIAAVVALIGLGDGLRMAITSQFGFLGTDVLSVQASGLNMAGPPGSGAVDPLSDELVEEIDGVQGVNVAFNRYIRSATLQFNDYQQIGFLVSMPEGESRKVLDDMLNIEVSSGRNLRERDTNKVLVGSSVAQEDNWDGKEIRSGDNLLIQDKKFEVVGVLEKKGSFVVDGSLLMNEDDLLDLLGDDGTTDIIAIQVEDEDEILDVKEDVEKVLRRERDVKEGEEDFSVETPQSTLETLNSTLFAVQLFVTIIASISLLVGGIGITNTMYTSVVERTKEIGIMKSIGATRGMIFQVFLYESGLLGLVGGLIGAGIGWGLAYGLATVASNALGIDAIQAHVSWTLVLGALAFSFIVGLASGLTPALQAAKKHPVDALRFVK